MPILSLPPAWAGVSGDPFLRSDRASPLHLPSILVENSFALYVLSCVGHDPAVTETPVCFPVFLSGVAKGSLGLGTYTETWEGNALPTGLPLARSLQPWRALTLLGDHPVIVPSSEEGGLRGLRVCFAFCVRPVVTKGRFPLVTVELASARTDPGSSGAAGLGTLWGSHTQEGTWVTAASCCFRYAPILPW